MPGKDRIDSFINIPAVKKEYDQLINMLEDLFATIKKAGNADALKNPSIGMKELRKAIADAIKESEKMATSAKKVAAATDVVERAKARVAASEMKAAKELAFYNQQLKENNRDLRIQAELENAVSGSIEHARAMVKKLNTERNQLNLTTEASKKRQKELNDELDKYNDFIKKNVDKLSQQKINIGNYEGSAKIIVDAFEKARLKVEALGKAADASPAALQRAKAEFEALRNVVDNKQFLSFTGNMGDATKEVRTFQRTLINLETQGMGNSEVAQELRKRLAELTDTIADTRAEVKALSSDTRTFDMFASSVNFAVDVFQTAVGAMTAFGTTEEDAAEATKTLLALQTLSNGVQGIANELTTKGTAANKLFAFSQKQLATAFDSTAAAGARFRAMLVTLGIGAIIVGIGLLITNFGKIKDAITNLSKSQKAYYDSLAQTSSKYTEAVKQVNELRINIDLAKQGFLDKGKVVRQYNETIGKTTGQVKTLDEAEQALAKNADAYIKMTLFKAAAQVALEEAAKKAFEAEQTRLQAEKDLKADEGSFRSKFSSEEELKKQRDFIRKRRDMQAKETEKEGEDIASIAKKFQEQAAEIAKKFKFNFFDDNQSSSNKKFYDGELKRQSEAFKKLSENEDAYRITRISAREKSYEIDRQILAGQKKAEIENAAGDANRILEIEKDYQEKRKELKAKFEEDNIAITQSSLAKQREILQADMDLAKDIPGKTPIEELIDREDIAFEKRKAHLEEGRDILIAALEKEKNAKLDAARTESKRQKIEEAYSRKRAQVEIDTNITILKSALDTAKKKLEILDNPADKAALEAQIAELKRMLSELSGQKIKLNTDDLQKVKTVIEDIGAKMSETFGAISDLMSAGIDRQKNAIQDQIDDNEKLKAAELDRINSSTLTEQDKAAKVALLESTAAARREALERKQRELDLKKARFDKARNVMEAIVRASVATIEGLIKGGPLLAALYGAIGAAQVVAAIAAPLPRFAEGTDYSPEGIAFVGEKGRELRIDPDGRASFTPDKASLTWLERGTRIIPNDELNKIMYAGMVRQHAQMIEAGKIDKSDITSKKLDGVIEAVVWLAGEMKRSNSKIKPPNVIITDMSDWKANIKKSVFD